MKNLFRTLIILQMLVWFGIMFAANTSFRELQREFAIPTSLFATTAEFGRIGELLFVGLLIASIGLLASWDVSRHIYAVLIIGDMLLGAFQRTVFRDGVTDMFHGTDAIVTGVILAMIYFSPLRDLFTNPRPAAPLAEIPPPPFPPQAVPPQSQPKPAKPAAFTAQEPVRTLKPQKSAPAESGQVCAACGAREQESKFCTQCGQPVAGKPRCARCGTEATAGERFCLQCGSAMSRVTTRI